MLFTIGKRDIVGRPLTRPDGMADLTCPSALERGGHLAHARTASFGRQCARAEACVAAALRLATSPYVAFSAGKDSAAMLWLVRQQAPTIPARLLTSGETRLLHPNLDAVLAWWRAQGAAIEEIRIDRVYDGADADWQTQRKAGRGDLRRLLPGAAHDGVFLGLRAEESNRRRIALSRRRDGHAIRAIRLSRRTQWRAAPLADWRTTDVAAVEALFVNGGNIKAGAKQPNNPFGLAAQIRATFPLLDLLGGVVDSFDLGESRVKVAAWVVCRENRPALDGTLAAELPAASVSIFDLLDDVTHTRQATSRGEGQMIYAFQTLCAGTQMVVRLSVDRGTRPETVGALVSAVQAYETGHARVGGQGARGFGAGRLTRVEMPAAWADAAAAYYAHLATERDALRAALVGGTLGTGRALLS